MLDWTRLTPAVNRAASIAASSFPSHHDLDDVKQAIWLWVMENKNTVTRVLADPKTGIGALDGLLLKAANSHLKAEDAQVYGYGEEDKFFYSTSAIKEILEVVFSYQDWQSFASALDAMPKSKSDPSLGGNNLASYADVKSAVERLPEDHYNAIVWRYKYRYTHAQIGEAMGFTRQRAQQVLDIATSGIQRLLGERSLTELRQGYDGRTADAVTRGRVGGMTSVNAQAIIERDWSG